ncbi:MAG: MFS transporter [Candidatus Paceibacterota bacterium]
MINKTIKEYYLLVFLNSASMGFIASTYAMFLISNGLNLFQVNLVNFVFFLTLFIAEIPTGAFADVFGRKKSYLMSRLIMLCGFLVYYFSNNFAGFITAEFVIAVGCTFASGAFRAWFVDKLKHHGYTESLRNIFSRSAQISQLAVVAAGLFGAWISDISIKLPFVCSIITFGISFVVAIFLKEDYFVPQKFSFRDGFDAMKNTVKSSINYGVKNKNVRFVLLVVMVMVFSVQPLNMYWQPFFAENLSGRTELGFVFVGIPLSLMLGAFFVPRLLKFIPNEKLALSFSQIGIGLMVVVTSLIGFPASLVMFFAHEVFRGMFNPLKDAYLHDQIPSKERATIESFDSMFHHFGGAVGLLVSGFLAVRLGIHWTWFSFGSFLIAFTVLVIWISRSRK